MAERTLAACIARCQPLQQRHVDALRDLRARHGDVVLVLGGVTQPPSVVNPWTLEERRRMLDTVLGPDAVRVVPVADCWYDDARWAAAVVTAVTTAPAGLARAADGVTVYGLERNGATHYAELFPAWEAREVEAMPFDGTLHERLLGGASVEACDAVPEALRACLAESLATPLRRELREEFRFVQRYREDWSCAPYTPVFVTVDALVTHGDRLLVIRRARRPGAGLLALPGGFIDVDEFVRDSALRELREETGLVLTHEQCREVRVFDHPLRSLRGRIITHLHRYEWPATEAAPAVTGGDDAADAFWLSRADARPEEFFEDHYAMLQVALGLP